VVACAPKSFPLPDCIHNTFERHIHVFQLFEVRNAYIDIVPVVDSLNGLLYIAFFPYWSSPPALKSTCYHHVQPVVAKQCDPDPPCLVHLVHYRLKHLDPALDMLRAFLIELIEHKHDMVETAVHTLTPATQCSFVRFEFLILRVQSIYYPDLHPSWASRIHLEVHETHFWPDSLFRFLELNALSYECLDQCCLPACCFATENSDLCIDPHPVVLENAMIERKHVLRLGTKDHVWLMLLLHFFCILLLLQLVDFMVRPGKEQWVQPLQTSRRPRVVVIDTWRPASCLLRHHAGVPRTAQRLLLTIVFQCGSWHGWAHMGGKFVSRIKSLHN
jgi:hypothetical protein